MKDKALRLALDALENHTAIKHPQQIHYRDAAIDAIKEALAQPAQEPVVNEKGTGQIATTPPQSAQEPVGKWTGKEIEWSDNPYKFKQGQFIYTTPPQRPWVGLTDEEREYWIGCNTTKQALARAIDNALKEKNT
jgi:hypothetical protein